MLDLKGSVNIIEILKRWKRVIRIGQEDLKMILSIAIETGLSFYDSAYLYFAKTRKLTLITKDKELFRKGKGIAKIEFIR